MTLRYSISFKVLNPSEVIAKLKEAALEPTLPSTEVLEWAHRYLWIEHVKGNDLCMVGETQ